MYEVGKTRPVETIPGMGGSKIKNDGGVNLRINLRKIL
jgi:hypothetical protein